LLDYHLSSRETWFLPSKLLGLKSLAVGKVEKEAATTSVMFLFSNIGASRLPAAEAAVTNARASQYTPS
jgi:hypothetical protein